MELSEILILLLSIGLTILASVYWYLTWHFGYWEKQGVGADKPYPLLGTLKQPWKLRPEEQDTENYLKYGKIYGVYEGRHPGLHVSQPDLLHYIFVEDASVFPNRRMLNLSHDDVIAKQFLSNMRGEKWKRMRTDITPTFDDDAKLKQIFSSVSKCAARMIVHLQFYVDISEAFEARKSFSAFTLDTIAKCAFGKELDSVGTPADPFVVNAKKLFTNQAMQFFLMYYAPSLLRFHSPIFHEKSFGYFAQLIQETIDKRRDDPNHVLPDFLQFLTESQKCARDDGNEETETSQLDVVTFQAVLFLLAGHETTATAIALATYCLALNPDVQERLIKDIDKIKDVKYETINKISYLDKVINETLRLYPPFVRTERTCSKDDYDLGGITLREGMVVTVPIYCIHHDPENYPEPESFDPERFSEQRRALRDPFTYLPFGYGERSCLGLKLALMIIKISLIYVLKHFRVGVCSKTEIPLNFNFSGLLLQPKSITLQLKPRSDEIRTP